MTWKHGDFVPARATLALDSRSLEGPEVDQACDAEEPAVDRWEYGSEVPTEHQVRLLAVLTGFAVEWFYNPLPVGPLSGTIIMCDRSKRKNGCTVVQPHVITKDQVLLYEGEPRPVPKPPRRAKPKVAKVEQEALFRCGR